MRWNALVFSTLMLAPVAAAAAPAPDPAALVHQMKRALEPDRDSIRDVTISIDAAGQTRRLEGRIARRHAPDGNREVVVMTGPADIRGTALLVSEPSAATRAPDLWMYAPVLRRVRKVVPLDAFAHFLDTDFTYADLGYVRLHSRYTSEGATEEQGRKAWKLDEELPATERYYSHVVTYVDQASHLPLRREFYDLAGALWKVEVFDSVEVIDGTPTVLHATMKDVQAGTSTDLRVSGVRYDVKLPDDLFAPEALGRAAEHPAWDAVAPATKR